MVGVIGVVGEKLPLLPEVDIFGDLREEVVECVET